ncbi:speE [Symbiodinium natans]|uniref:SpeE protein n=1 Tax=Symbiodinium natans TaxID=878477 RepID=A0A812NDC3_9DINO|nr:speE [Symbiodinium natans]
MANATDLSQDAWRSILLCSYAIYLLSIIAIKNKPKTWQTKELLPEPRPKKEQQEKLDRVLNEVRKIWRRPDPDLASGQLAEMELVKPQLRRGLLHESNRRTDVLEKAVSAFVAAYALGDGVLLLRRPIGELLAERMNLMHNELQEQVKKNRFTLKLRAQFTVFDVVPLASVQSKYQKIEVLKSEFFGNILTIDGDLMLTERDEFIYHEMIAHVPMAYVPTARRILVVGGGDGGSAKQLLRRESVENVTVVELDEEVVRISQQFFPRLASAFGDPRVELRLESGASWVERQVASEGTARAHEADRFDIIIVDSTDFGASEPLFEEAFRRSLRRLLAKGGVIVINLTSLPWQLGLVQRSVHRQRLLFKYVRVFQIHQPTYTSGHYCFLICSDALDPLDLGAVDWESYEDEVLEMGYYSRKVHEASFALPQYAVAAVSEALRNAAQERKAAASKDHAEEDHAEL